eukprot:TRINITY_DN7444_c0_g1_i2.p1 TRINITY_DN7444_c0_g1~~TRINITY_DN7444_c0_g1_i2.p1  ORF type:complete len:545 (+),score=97.04 TRINITY_DN7444_c0_g1_i2:112-1746(+)
MADARAKYDPETIINEAFNKIVHIVLQSRFNFPPDPKPKKNGWFNLETDDNERIHNDMDTFKRGPRTAVHVQLHVESVPQLDAFASTTTARTKVLLEHWEVFLNTSQASTTASSTGEIYMPAVLMIRALYTCLRMLPTLSLIRATRKHQHPPFTFGYTVSPVALASGPSAWGDVEPGRFDFAPISTHLGAFTARVFYRKDLNRFLSQVQSGLSDFNIMEDYTVRPRAISTSGSRASSQQQQQLTSMPSTAQMPSYPVGAVPVPVPQSVPRSAHSTPPLSSTPPFGSLGSHGFIPTGPVAAHSHPHHPPIPMRTPPSGGIAVRRVASHSSLSRNSPSPFGTTPSPFGTTPPVGTAPIGIPMARSAQRDSGGSYTPESHSFKMIPNSYPTSYGCSPPFCASPGDAIAATPSSGGGFVHITPPFSVGSPIIVSKPVVVHAAPPQSPSAALRRQKNSSAGAAAAGEAILGALVAAGVPHVDDPIAASADGDFNPIGEEVFGFAGTDEMDADSALGSFVQQCRNAPPLKLFQSQAAASTRSVVCLCVCV